MKIRVIPKDHKDNMTATTCSSFIEVTSTEGFDVGDLIDINGKTYKITWVEPMPKELHSTLQLLIKFLFVIGVFAACILASGLFVFIISIIIGAIHAIFNYPT